MWEFLEQSYQRIAQHNWRLRPATHPLFRCTVIDQEIDVGKFGWFVTIVIWVIIFPISLVLVLGILLAFMMDGGA